MKKTLPVLLLAAIPLTVFAQGKVLFDSGPSHLVVIDPSAAQVKGVPWLAGLPAPQTGKPNSVLGLLTAQLWAGTSEQNMTLQATLTPAGITGTPDGMVGNSSVTLNDVPPGPAFFRIYLWETAAGSYTNASTGGAPWWYGSTAIFIATAGSFAPPPLGFSSGWPAGPILLLANPQGNPQGNPPSSLTVSRIGNEFRFSFLAHADRTYTVEHSDSVSATNWIELTNIPAQAADRTIEVSEAMNAGERFFRVRTH